MNAELLRSEEVAYVDMLPAAIRSELAGMLPIGIVVSERVDNPTEYNGLNFDRLLADSFDRVCDGEDSVIDEIQDFIELSNPIFQEPATPEEELSHHVGMVEAAISRYVEENAPLTLLSTLNYPDLTKIVEIYNMPNLLAFAKDVVDRSDSFDMGKVDMIYRYRKVLYALFDQTVRICMYGDPDLMVSAEQSTEPDENIRASKIGAATWAGYFHRYGFEGRGEINSYEYRRFSEEPEDAGDGHTSVTAEGEKIGRLKGEFLG